jgi:cyclic pyranopterin phosphate synthase
MLQDSFNRQFSYLRLSVTDVCNFKCTYCLPHGYHAPVGEREAELSLLEIRRLLTGFSQAGFSKVRFTGGEPTTRSDLLQIIESAALIGFKKIALSTNGWKLREQVHLLKSAGLTHVNVSLDSLNSETFKRMTGQPRFQEILDGIDLAMDAGLPVKVNSVLHRDHSMLDVKLFLEWIKNKPVSVRFIELMKTGDHANYFQKNFISAGILKQELLSEGWKIIPRKKDAGPAVEFVHPSYLGTIGVIAPYSKDFCTTCNRLRVTSRGKLRLCLFGEEDHSLRSFLGSDDRALELPMQLALLLKLKTVGHRLNEGHVGSTTNLSIMGG